MKFTEKDIVKAFMEKIGIEINQKFNSSETSINPCHINQDYEIIDAEGDLRDLSLIIDAETDVVNRHESREAMHEKLKELANEFKPDWSDADQVKTSIGYSHRNEMCITRNTFRNQFSVDEIYFDSPEAAQKAIDYFTLNEWKMYFGVGE